MCSGRRPTPDLTASRPPSDGDARDEVILWDQEAGLGLQQDQPFSGMSGATATPQSDYNE